MLFSNRPVLPLPVRRQVRGTRTSNLLPQHPTNKLLRRPQGASHLLVPSRGRLIPKHQSQIPGTRAFLRHQLQGKRRLKLLPRNQLTAQPQLRSRIPGTRRRHLLLTPTRKVLRHPQLRRPLPRHRKGMSNLQVLLRTRLVPRRRSQRSIQMWRRPGTRTSFPQ